jgi:hypothetical protein
MGFNRRKLEDQRREATEKEAASRRATDAQVLEDAERLIGAPGTSGKPSACRCCSRPIDLCTLDRHPDAAVTSLIPSLSCRSCRPNAPFAELVRLSRTSIADAMWEEHRRRVLGE